MNSFVGKSLFASGCVLVLICFAGGMYWLVVGPPVGPAPVPPPIPSDYGFSASLPPLFADKAEGKRDARRLAGQLDALANAVERDGAREAPQLTYVASVYDLWRTATVELLDGRGEDYKGFYAVIKAVIVGKQPDTNASLDKAARASIVSIFHAAAKACRKAG